MNANSDFGNMVARHRAYFLAGKTRPVEWRAAQLKALSALITEKGNDFRAALWTDLRRNWVEANLIDVEEIIDYVNARSKPLGLYVFAEDLDIAEHILDSTESGDAGVNDCTIQPLMPELPFGGVGNSGMGKYHGEWGFGTYTNARGVLYHSTIVDAGFRYPPYPSEPAP